MIICYPTSGINPPFSHETRVLILAGLHHVNFTVCEATYLPGLPLAPLAWDLKRQSHMRRPFNVL